VTDGQVDSLTDCLFVVLHIGQNITIQPGVHYTLSPPVRPATTPTAKASQCLGYGCEHFCREDRRRIPVCYCRNGYLIDSDGKTCVGKQLALYESIQICDS